MKPIRQLCNVESAKLFHQLLPEEIPGFLNFTIGICQLITKDEQKHRLKWQANPIIDFETWFCIAQKTSDRIVKYGVRFHKSASLFSDQLFDGFDALYLNHCMQKYSESQECPVNFKRAFALFFECKK